MPRQSKFIHLLFHQCRKDFLHLRFPATIFLFVLLLRLLTHLEPHQQHLTLFSFFNANWVMELLTHGIAATTVCMSIFSDCASNSHATVRTRPIGPGVVFLAKILLLAVIVLFPWLLVDFYAAKNFGYTPSLWTGRIAAIVLSVSLVISFTAAITSLASNPRQLLIFMTLAILGSLVWIEGTQYIQRSANLPPMRLWCGGIVSAIVGLVALLMSWAISSITHRRTPAFWLFIFAIGQQPFTKTFWPHDWFSPPSLNYPSTNLSTLPQPSSTVATQNLFQTLSLSGLRQNEVASIVAFAPMIPGDHWPPDSHYRDYEPDRHRQENWSTIQWLHLDHLRAIARQSDPDLLWSEFNPNHRVRRDLVEKTPHLETALQYPWKLRLAIHNLRQVADLSLETFQHHRQIVPLLPGSRLELNVVSRPHFEYEVSARIHSRFDALTSHQSFAPLEVMDYRIPTSFMVVVHDPVTRENSATPVVATSDQSFIFNWIWQVTERCDVFLPVPQARFALTPLNFESWMKRARLQIWLPEYRGTVDLEITADQMRQLVETSAK